MAGGESSSCAEMDAVELEAMRKDSFSWHPCHVSLCSSGSGLIVEYEDNHSQEVITDKEKVLSRVRVRSSPLQGDDCSTLEQGNHVLAQSSLAKGLLCDARVEKAIRVRHSKRTHCRCSFTIKWLHESIADVASTVPASGVMRLSTKSINLHPSISTFFSKLGSTNGINNVLGSEIDDTMNWEMDINVLLEKQIQKIGNASDAPDKKISRNVCGLAADVRGVRHDRTPNPSLNDPNAPILFLNNLKFPMWCDKNQLPDIIIETTPASVLSIQEGPGDNRLPLSPLAARAALALLRSNCPQLPLNVSASSMERSPNFKITVESCDMSSIAHIKGSKKKSKITEKGVSRSLEMRLTRSRIQKAKGVDESSGITGENSNDPSGKVEAISGVDRVEEIFSEDAENQNRRKRITRSAAREMTKKENVPFISKPEKNGLSESDEKNVINGKGSTDSKRVKTIPKTEGCSQGTKNKCVTSTKRFSPRLKLLPRTKA